MLVYMKTENFKSLHKTEIRFSDFTVLVGNNASGKSTILQAIDFLVRSAEKDFSDFLEKRGYSVSDVLCKLTPAKERKIRFVSEWTLPEKVFSNAIRWELEIDCFPKENMMRLGAERVLDAKTGRPLLVFEGTKNSNSLLIYGMDGKKLREYPSMALNSSSLKVTVNTLSREEGQSIPELVAFKQYLSASCSYDLLSPAEMRQSSRGAVKTIGSSGRDLPSYIKSLPVPAKLALQGKLQNLTGHTVEAVETHTEERPGWTRIEALEKYGDKTVPISSKNMSDGLLRLLAFLAISESENVPCMMLLDEIENGININLTEKLMQILKESCSDKKQQMIVTTHSTVFLDYIQPEDIVFLRRNRDTGWTEAFGMLDIAGMSDRLQYLYPGEVILNMTPKERAELVLSDDSEDEGEGEEG